VIGASLEAHVEITAEGATLKALESVATDLSALMIVSKVRLVSGPLKVSATKALGKKCARCWHYYDASEESQKLPDICPKCVRALS
jgi:isoleucyl-tRNA synthetase